MRGDTIVINSSSKRVAGEVRGFVLNAQGAGRVCLAHSAGDFREAVRGLRPRLAFVETNCWYEASQYMIAQYAEAFPWMSIAVFGYERLTPGKAAGFINLGAESYVDLRLDDEKEIAEAFNRIVRDKTYVPKWIEETMDQYSLASPEYSRLQKCEIPVLRLVAMGNGIEEIAVKLGIERGTVRNHISNIHRKFNIHTVTDKVSLALRLGVVHPDELFTKEIDIHILEQEAADVHTDKERIGAC